MFDNDNDVRVQNKWFKLKCSFCKVYFIMKAIMKAKYVGDTSKAKKKKKNICPGYSLGSLLSPAIVPVG